MPLLEFLSGTSERQVGDGVVIGYAMVLEVIDENGSRGIAKVTSDAGGHPLPWYIVEGLASALSDANEFDDPIAEEDLE